eukprot:1391770-Amorphochlora_amoeboformis.AAC.2
MCADLNLKRGKPGIWESSFLHVCHDTSGSVHKVRCKLGVGCGWVEDYKSGPALPSRINAKRIGLNLDTPS